MKLALRSVVESRPVRAMRALFMRVSDARDSLRDANARRRPGDSSARGAHRDAKGGEVQTRTERVKGLDGAVTIARDPFGVPGIFASTLADVGFGMGWACADDRLFQIELLRRAMRGELAATFGDRPVDEGTWSKAFAGRSFVDLDAFVRAIDFRAAAESSWAVCSEEGRRWLDAYAAGINAYLASGRRPMEMLLLDVEPRPWTGVDALLVGKAIAFQLSFSWRFALAHALVQRAVDERRASALRPVRHPMTATAVLGRGDARSSRDFAPVMETAEALRAVLGVDGIHLGSNAFAVAPTRSSLGTAMLASDPHMPLGAPGLFWEARLRGGGLDVRGFGVPGFPALPIGQNDRGAWGVTAGWGDDTQLWIEDLASLRQDGRLRSRVETIEVRGGAARRVELLETPRGCVVSHVLDVDALVEQGVAREEGLVLRWAGRDSSPDADAALALMRAQSFDELRAAARLHASPTLNFVWADADGHVGWQYAGRIPKRAGNLDRKPNGRPRFTGLDVHDGEDARSHWQGWIPFDALPWTLDPPSGIVVSANVDPSGPDDPHVVGEMFEPPFRFARIHALLDAHARTHLDPHDFSMIQRDVRSAWALHVRDVLFENLDDETLGLAPRRGRTVAKLARAWDGHADEDSAGALATYALIDAVVRHLFLDELGEEAFERYFEIMNVGALPILRVLRDEDASWLEGRDRATIVRDAAAMAEGRLRRRLGDDPTRWRWGALHTLTFEHALVPSRSSVRSSEESLLGPGLRAIASPGPYPARGDGTTVCMGEFDVRGDFSVRVAPALRTIMIAGLPAAARAVAPPGQSGDPTSRHYRDQIAPYLRGETRPASWNETDFTGRRVRLVPD